ncbi:hypothetical protein BDD12DRAFT_831668 [Trichophaea hybrida]|nr:hypothetical protein BDD12DRAFT_831668 [Trichophaea hybrida]
MTIREVNKHIARIIEAPAELKRKFLSRIVDSLMPDERKFLGGLLKVWEKSSSTSSDGGSESTSEDPAPKRAKLDHPQPGLRDTRLVPATNPPQMVLTSSPEQPTCNPQVLIRNYTGGVSGYFTEGTYPSSQKCLRRSAKLTVSTIWAQLRFSTETRTIISSHHRQRIHFVIHRETLCQPAPVITRL